MAAGEVRLDGEPDPATGAAPDPGVAPATVGEASRSVQHKYALAYARHGWPVFPCHWITEAGCSCGKAACDSPGKHPLTLHGLNEATTDPAQITAWWTTWPYANIGAAMGNGRVAVDFDGVEHEATWPPVVKALRSANTPRSKTGRQDGMHVFARVPDGLTIKSRAGVWPGVDVRGEGGYVILPPSMHHTGRGYEWINDLNYELAELPAELVDMLTAPASSGGAAHPNEPGWIKLSDEQVAEIRSALRCLSAEPRDQWLRMCMALKSTGAGEQAFEIWDTWSATCPKKYKPNEQRATWGGITETLRDAGEVTIRSLFWAAQQAGWQNPLSKEAAGEPRTDPKTWKWKTDLDYFNSPFLAPRYVVKGVVPAAATTLVFGASGACKSFFVIDMAMRITRGLPCCGRKVTTGAVLIFANEGREGYDARIKAWCREFDPSGCPDPSGHRVHVLESAVPSLAEPQSWAEIEAAIAALGVPVKAVIVDTLSTCAHIEDENNNAVVAHVVALANEFAARTGCAVVIVHHTRKGAATELGLESARGAGALGANVSAAIQLRRYGNSVRATIVKMKDGPSEVEFSFTRKFVEIGKDEDGEAVSPPVLVLAGQRDVADLRQPAILLCRQLAEEDPKRAGVIDSRFRELAGSVGIGSRERQDAVAEFAIACGWLTKSDGGRGKRRLYKWVKDPDDAEPPVAGS